MNETEIAIVAALIQQPLYGPQLIERVAEISDNRVRLSVGGVYTTLNRMQRKRLIAGYWGDESETRGGARRRYYKVTALGEREFRQTGDMLIAAGWRPRNA